MSEVEEVISLSFIRMDVCTRVLCDQSSEFAGLIKHGCVAS